MELRQFSNLEIPKKRQLRALDNTRKQEADMRHCALKHFIKYCVVRASRISVEARGRERNRFTSPRLRGEGDDGPSPSA
jgi:hypothetical protein